MQIQVGPAKIDLKLGDITNEATDCIVNAANAALAGGGGVDGAIHRRGGPTIMEETDRRFPDGCPTGSAVTTQAGDLPSQYVIHAVGPIWRGGGQNEPEQLRSAYQSCLREADASECSSIAFPALSTGAYNYPVEDGAEVALRAVIDYLRGEASPISMVRFVLFDRYAYDAFEFALRGMARELE